MYTETGYLNPLSYDLVWYHKSMDIIFTDSYLDYQFYGLQIDAVAWDQLELIGEI